MPETLHVRSRVEVGMAEGCGRAGYALALGSTDAALEFEYTEAPPVASKEGEGEGEGDGDEGGIEKEPETVE